LILFLKNLDILRLIVVVHAKIVSRQIGDKVPMFILDCGEDVYEIDIDFERLLSEIQRPKGTKKRRDKHEFEVPGF